MSATERGGLPAWIPIIGDDVGFLIEGWRDITGTENGL